MTSTYLGSMTIVLKLPLSIAASTNGLQRYNGFCAGAPPGEGGGGGAPACSGGNVADVGVGERLGGAPPRGARFTERLGGLLAEARQTAIATLTLESRGRKTWCDPEGQVAEA